MALALDPRHPAGPQLPMLLQSEIDKALAALRGAPEAEAVHAARRHIKKARALSRLLPGEPADRALRRAGRSLSTTRDAAVRRQVVDALLADNPPADASRALRRLRKALPDDPASTRPARRPLQAARRALRAARHDSASASASAPTVDDDALCEAFAATYRRGRRALRRASARPDAERLHALRKAVKHHLYQLRVLTVLWPTPLTALAAEVDRAAELLGAHHDGELLRAVLPSAGADRRAVETLLGARQTALTEQSLALCRRLYAEPARHWRRRLGAYLRAAASG